MLAAAPCRCGGAAITYPYSFGALDWWMLVWAAFLVMGVVALMVLLAVTPATPRSIDHNEPKADTRAR